MVYDKYMVKVVLVNLPNNKKRPRHRWIVKKMMMEDILQEHPT